MPIYNDATAASLIRCHTAAVANVVRAKTPKDRRKWLTFQRRCISALFDALADRSPSPDELKQLAKID